MCISFSIKMDNQNDRFLTVKATERVNIQLVHADLEKPRLFGDTELHDTSKPRPNFPICAAGTPYSKGLATCEALPLCSDAALRTVYGRAVAQHRPGCRRACEALQLSDLKAQTALLAAFVGGYRYT